jgi:hypothetical protein
LSKKDKEKKKISAKKEKFLRYRKQKDSNINFVPFDFSDDELKEVRTEEKRVEKYFKFSRNKNPHEIVKRREIDKR